MERLSTIRHGGAAILVVDYSDVKEQQDTLDLVWASSDRIVASPSARCGS